MTKPLYSLLVLLTGLSPLSLPAQTHTREQNFTLETKGFRVMIRPEAAFTMGSISYHDMPVGQKNGNWGTVVAYDGLNFVGSGHTEGGVEEVKEIALTVDGTRVNPSPLGENIVVDDSAVLEKTSRLGDSVELHAVTTFGPESIILQRVLRILKDTTFSKIYPFMFIWSKNTSEFMAKTDDGKIVEGSFESNGDWKVQADVRWMAAYEPEYGLAILTIFPADMPKGGERTRKHAYNDHAAYHKQYFIFADRQEFSAGDEFTFEAEIRVIEADPAAWKEKVKEAVESIESQVKKN